MKTEQPEDQKPGSRLQQGSEDQAPMRLGDRRRAGWGEHSTLGARGRPGFLVICPACDQAGFHKKDCPMAPELKEMAKRQPVPPWRRNGSGSNFRASPRSW